MVEKKVDESWKEQAETDKVKPEPEKAPEAIQPDFSTFLTGLFMEAMIALGEAENPFTHKKEVNAAQAQYIIEIIQMLKDKTKGNLSAQEANALDNGLYQLKMVFVKKSGSGEASST